MASFYASLDQWVVQIICDLKAQNLDHLCMLNWGFVPEYEILHKPLAEQAMEQQANAGPGEPQGPGMGLRDDDGDGVYGESRPGGGFRMALDPVAAVGEGVLSASELVEAAQRVLRMGWVRHKGSRGGRGWKNTQTGEIRYQEEMPDDQNDAVGFASPNTEENLTFEQAMQNLDSPQHARMKAKFQGIDEAVGVEHQSLSIIGDWGDGAEDSILTVYSNYTDLDELRFIMAWKGLVSDQKAVLLFEQNQDGPHTIYEFVTDDSISSVRQVLSSKGLDFRSIATLNESSHRVYVVDLDGTMATSIAEVKRHFNVRIQETRGQGEFIGVDSERSRSESRQEYARIIREYEEKWPDRRRYSDQTPTRFSLGVTGHAINRPLVIGIGQKPTVT